MTLTGRPGEATSDEYATPRDLWRPLDRAVGGFDLDPASGAESAPLADERYTKEDDGLSQPWFGSVWLNPPFGDRSGNGTGQRERWVHQARQQVAQDSVDRVVCLLPVDTSTDWFHRHVVDAEVICFLSGRPQFEGESVHTGFACMVVVFGDVPVALTRVLEDLGAVFRGRAYAASQIQSRLPQLLSADGGDAA